MRFYQRPKPRADGYKSGLESQIAKQIEEETGKPAQYEKLRIPYTVPETKHTYTPDFQLPNGIIIEGKGIFDAKDRCKQELVKAQHPELDIRFCFSSSKKPIYPKSPTSVADWCRERGFKFCEKVIPKSWFKERKHAA